MKTTAVFEEARRDQETTVSTPPQVPAPSPQPSEASPFAQKELVKRECTTIINKYKKMLQHGH